MFELGNKKILVLFCGGDKPDPKFNEKALKKKIADSLELQMVAHVDAEFIWQGYSADISFDLWPQLAERVAKNYHKYDGFVITHGVDNVLYSSSMLSFMLQNLSKPVVFAGTPLASLKHLKKESLDNIFHQYSPLNIDTNIINAAQVASMEMPGVSLVYGTNIIKAIRAQLTYDSEAEIFSSWQTKIMGNVKFGINLSKDSHKKAKPKLKLNTNFEPKIKIIDFYPGFDEEVDLTGYQGVAIKAHLEKYFPENFKLKTDLPVLVYTQGDFKDKNNYIKATGYTWETAVVKFMWALGQSKKVEKIRKIIKTNLVGELG